MARLKYSDQALSDLIRLTEFLLANDRVAANSTVDLIEDGIETLTRHPFVGHSVDADLRELLISRGRSGYVALYTYREFEDIVVILAIRHQREAGYWNVSV